MSPKARLTMMSTPMWTGLMCATCVSATMIGMKIAMAGTPSRKSPAIVRTITMRYMMTIRLSPATARAEEVAVHHEPDPDREPGGRAAHEQPGDGDVADRAVDDRHDAGRHHRGDRRGRRHERRRERRIVAFALHVRHDHGADRRDV